MKPRTKRAWADLASLCGQNIQIIFASLSVDDALPPGGPGEKYELSCPLDDAERTELERAAETILAGESVLSFAATTRWQLAWRLQAAQHVFRWYAKNPVRKSDRLAHFLNTLDRTALMRCFLADSDMPFALLGAAATHLLGDICCMPGLLRLLPVGKETVPLCPRS